MNQEAQVPVYPVGTWKGWVTEYLTDGWTWTPGKDPEVNPGRVNDVVTYMTALYGDREVYLTRHGWEEMVGEYRDNGPEVEDHWTDTDTRTLDDLDRYVHARYENQLEVDGLTE